jgi:hypothetical protein
MPGSRLQSAVSDAELLVEFAARNGIDVDSTLVNTVSATRAAVDAGTITQAQEAAFFEAYIKLSHALGKVTVSSIRDSRDEFGIERPKYLWFGPKIRISRAQLAVKRFRRQAVLALLVLLITQIYWLWGSTLTDNLQQVETRDAELKKINMTSATEAEVQAVTTEQNNLYFRFTTLDSLLRDWSAVWGLFGKYQKPNYKDVPSVYPNHLMLRVPAENRLVVFQVYVLPLLYGLVGACAYVLRQLIIETRERTYQAEARPAYDLRIFLGMLSGLAVGWFLRPDSQGKMIGQLTPFALSFLAGYSVEVLFSAMDKLVNAFGSVSQTSKG